VVLIVGVVAYVLYIEGRQFFVPGALEDSALEGCLEELRKQRKYVYAHNMDILAYTGID
jgi:hypothetical protein